MVKIVSNSYKFSTELKDGNENVESCYSCQYFQDSDGSVQGNPSCAREAEYAGAMKCPRYAQTACMEAASFHTSYQDSQIMEV